MGSSAGAEGTDAECDFVAKTLYLYNSYYIVSIGRMNWLALVWSIHQFEVMNLHDRDLSQSSYF